MKKILILAVVAMAMTSVFAAPYWMLVSTTGAKSETTGDFSYYTAYYCSTDQAKSLFGGATKASDITTYLEANWGTFEHDLAGQKLGAYGFDEGEFSFSKYFQTAQNNMIAIVTYAGDENMVRVFDGVAAGNGSVLFDGAAGTAIPWATRPVPEPTSGLLILLGMAGLALKRKRV